MEIEQNIPLKFFLTFGGGGQKYYDAANRIVQQAKSLDLFNNIIKYTDEDLKNDTVFWPLHCEFIQKNPRGYGYWLWKPYLIKKTMEQLKDGDYLMYLDCGCEIDIRKKNKLLEHFELVKEYNIIYSSTGSRERDWNKMDLVVKLGMNEDKHLVSMQNQGGLLLILVNDITRKLINDWYELGCDYHNIDDSPSIIPNCKDFREHRHDQSIFSLLTKKMNLHNDDITLINCIEVLRNLSGESKIR